MAAASYASIDPTIRAWTERHGFTLFDRIEGMGDSVRCIYVSSEKGECFQIWIDQPESGVVSIHAADVETHNDETLEEQWSVPLASLEAALEEALGHVQRWIAR